MRVSWLELALMIVGALIVIIGIMTSPIEAGLYSSPLHFWGVLFGAFCFSLGGAKFFIETVF